MKTIEIKDSETILVDGETYRKEISRPIKPIEPTFKVGDWIIGIDGYAPRSPFRITAIKGIHFDSENGKGVGCEDAWRSDLRDEFYVRLCSHAEIETHLKKICDEKYIGKKVRSLFLSRIGVVTGFCTYKSNPGADELWYYDEQRDGTLIYSNGKWAEIIPAKKQLPKTKMEFFVFMDIWVNDYRQTTDEFLDQYNFED